MRKLLVLLSAVAFVVAFAIPAMASDWNFYGSARMNTFFTDTCNPTGFDDEDFIHVLQGNARVGATVKGGPVGGRFEYGVTDQAGSHFTARVRRLYGTWNFGAGTLKVGRDYTPVTTLYSDQVRDDDTGLLGYGMPYAGRQGQVSLQMKGLNVALITPSTKAGIIAGSTEQDTSLPKIEASYDFKAGPAGVGVFLGMNSYDDVDAANAELGVDSMAYGFRAKMNFGAAYLKVGAYMGENLGTYGWAGGGTPTATGTTVNDSDDMGYFLVAGFKASDTIGLQAGYGYSERELSTTGSKTDDAVSYYIQAKIDFAKNVFIVPEYGVFDKKDNAAGADEGDTSYYGLKWQINF